MADKELIKTAEREIPDSQPATPEATEYPQKEFAAKIKAEADGTVQEFQDEDSISAELPATSAQFANASKAVNFKERAGKLVDFVLQAKEAALKKLSKDKTPKVDTSLEALDAISQREYTDSGLYEWIKAVVKAGDLDRGLAGLQKAKELGMETGGDIIRTWLVGCADANKIELAASYLQEQKEVGDSQVLPLLEKAASMGRLNEFGLPKLLKKLTYLDDGRTKFNTQHDPTTFLKALIREHAKVSKDLPKEAAEYILAAFYKASNWPGVRTKGLRDTTQEWPHQAEAFYQALQTQLERMGTEQDGEFEALRDMIDTNPDHKLLFHNVEMMQSLEQEAPGTVTSLYREFGIRNFQRYPKELLLKQDKEKNADIPYGIVMNAAADHDGNFSRNAKLYESFDQDLEQAGRTLRIVEVDGKKELSARLDKLDRQYGDKNKIEFVILGGHGQPGDIQLGPNENNHEDKIFQTDLKNTPLVSKGEYFSPDAEVVLNSCLVGTESGLAQDLSAQTGRKVTASKESISPTKLEAALDENGKLKINIEFNIADSKVQYDKGKLVE